ncbi:unnamed protein product [Rotaria sp. Silwood1]|nr:unnamed protein product [Rotaria sp. Silwood1]CAF1663455.1 unnamed protein product [Rotaria sp. Silwood1]
MENNEAIENNDTLFSKNGIVIELNKSIKYDNILINEPINKQNIYRNELLIDNNYNVNIKGIDIDDSNKLILLNSDDNKYISSKSVNDNVQMNVCSKLNEINSNTATLRKSDRLKAKQEQKYNLPETDISQNEYKSSDHRKRKKMKKKKQKESTQKTCDNVNNVQEQQTRYESALAQHIMEEKHNIDWLNSKVIWNDNNPDKLLIKESLMIKAFQPKFNRTTRSTPLYIFPEGLSMSLLPKRLQF